MRISVFFSAMAALTAAASTPAWAQTVQSSAGNLTATVLAEGLDHPWALGFLPDGRMLVTERSGQLRIIHDGVVGEPIAGTPNVYNEGQGGLLDLALAPDFATSGQIYLTFSERAEDAGLQRGRARRCYRPSWCWRAMAGGWKTRRSSSA